MNEQTLIACIITAFIGAFAGWVVRKVFPGNSEKREIINEPLKVTAATRLVRWEEHCALRSEFENLRSDLRGEILKIETQLQHNNDDGEKRAIKLHDRINEILASVSRLEGKLE